MISATSVQSKRSNWPIGIGGPELSLYDLVYNIPVSMGSSGITQKLGIIPTKVFKFTGTDYTSSARYPQGVAVFEDFVLTSFYYKYAPYQAACKLVVTNMVAEKTANVAICQMQAGFISRIDTHAGGMEIFGNYLYVENSFLGCIHVFDLTTLFRKADNHHCLDGSDPFFAEVDYLLIEVGRIQLNVTTNISFLSKCGENLVLGNFWIPGSQYSAGGKSMIWKLPMQAGVYEFLAPPVNVIASQLEPVYPANSLTDTGLSVEKIQGALVMPNGVVMLSRSYGSGTKQMMILTPNPEVFYNGNVTYPLGYDWKNWLYGCEDLSLTPDGSEVVTVTEFNGAREVSFWRLNDLLGLVGDFQPPTIAEHEADLANLLEEIEEKVNEAEFYQAQIESAAAANLERFDRATYVP